MEGDVLFLQGWPVIVAVSGAVLGGVFALLKWFAARLLIDIEQKLTRIDDVAREVGRVDAEVKRLIAELPLHYQRRDDAIREYTVINVKLDRLYELILREGKHE
ncbi:hypothetical protein [Thiobacter aerophilum]|uniref:Uncharacterized protein n=1 Tax=Thiobacter aerophilum TaxID=3121275 RepID=A0ABV0EDN0_9BURK